MGPVRKLKLDSRNYKKKRCGNISPVDLYRNLEHLVKYSGNITKIEELFVKNEEMKERLEKSLTNYRENRKYLESHLRVVAE